ncbi:MAG: metallophosphoesterase family protein [Lachnospiraceae bacterium]|nr:metallophosphoesterase family protein [Lachnospiraceae bacterium]
MKILIVSDTHGRTYYLDRLLENVGHIDYFIHLGDVCDVDLFTSVEITCPKSIICGNNDFFLPYPKEEIITLAGRKIWLTHGHRYSIYYGTDDIKKAAKEKGVDIVMCGHSHYPLIEQGEDIVVLNPGSLTFPRQSNRLPSYIIMEIDDNNEAHYTLNYLKN